MLKVWGLHNKLISFVYKHVHAGWKTETIFVDYSQTGNNRNNITQVLSNQVRCPHLTFKC